MHAARHKLFINNEERQIFLENCRQQRRFTFESNIGFPRLLYFPWEPNFEITTDTPKCTNFDVALKLVLQKQFDWMGNL